MLIKYTYQDQCRVDFCVCVCKLVFGYYINIYMYMLCERIRKLICGIYLCTEHFYVGRWLIDRCTGYRSTSELSSEIIGNAFVQW